MESQVDLQIPKRSSYLYSLLKVFVTVARMADVVRQKRAHLR